MKLTIPNFGLGQTYQGKDTAGNLINSHWLGQIHEFPYNNLDGSQVRGNRKRLTGRTIHAICLRNESGITLYGKRLARLTRTAGYKLLESVDGYCAVLGEDLCVIIDPQLSSAGVADDDIFWGIIKGPAVVLTPEAGAAFNGDIAVAATTQTSVAGRFSNVSIANATDAAGALEQAVNLIGIAMSARTTGETNADLLINACIQVY
jgi:hypothetical protein